MTPAPLLQKEEEKKKKKKKKCSRIKSCIFYRERRVGKIIRRKLGEQAEYSSRIKVD